MSRNAILATVFGALALVIGTFSAQATPLPKSTLGVHAAKSSLVQQAHYRRHHHHHHRWHR